MRCKCKVALLTLKENYNGFSFFHNLLGETGFNKDIIKCYWNNLPNDDEVDPPKVFVFDYNYKLYDDSTKGVSDKQRFKRFYDLKNDIEEKNPLPDNKLTLEQIAKKDSFISILKTMYP